MLQVVAFIRYPWWHARCSWFARTTTPRKRARKTSPMSKTTKLETIKTTDLEHVAGGASRVSARSGSNDQLTTMLTQVTSSIKDLASNQNKGGMDPMMMMMMMMMGGGGGGGGGAQAAAAPAPAPPPLPVVNVSVRG